MSHKIGNKGPSFIKYELPRKLEKAAGGPPPKVLEKQLAKKMEKLEKLLARLFKDGFEPSKPGAPAPMPAKTMAFPEEGGTVGGSTPPPAIRTMAMPEEGGR
jgi:hypothetical protein